MTEQLCKTPGCNFDKSKFIDSLSLIPNCEHTHIITFNADFMLTKGMICYQCLSEQQPKILYIQAPWRVNPRPVASLSLLSCLSNVTDFTMTYVDCKSQQQHIVDLIVTNKMPARTMMIYCNLDTIALVNAMVVNTSVHELDINSNVTQYNYPYNNELIDSTIKFISTNKTCNTLEFYMAPFNDSYDVLLPYIENNYTLLNLFGNHHNDTESYSLIKPVWRYLQRNAKYTRSIMTRLLIDIIIAMFPIIRQYELCPYVIMEIFKHLEPHYDKFWHRELTDIAIEIIHNNKNESL